ncbi:MAG: MoaD/ThiS family protein [Dehalococcoidia bacterium]|nr:MoaD/ThiS family protein [Dehalococcoidia bacterium]
MAVVLVPPLMRDLTGGIAHVTAPGTTVGQVLVSLDSIYPGFRSRLCQGDDISPYIGVVVDGVSSHLRLLQPVGDGSEIQFLPALQGG